mgnify:CR=1 FL=1
MLIFKYVIESSNDLIDSDKLFTVKQGHTLTYSGKSYDDTLIEEGTLWPWNSGSVSADKDEEAFTPDEDVISFWGPGYTPEMYKELEQRLRYYRSKMPTNSDPDMNTEMLLRQIAMMEIDINKARADGRPVDKMTNSLSSLLNSLQKINQMLVFL